MNKRTATWFVSLISGAAISACADPGRLSGGVTRISSALQSSVTATEDLSISTQNGGNGVTETTTEVMVWNITGSEGYTEEGLIRFGNIPVPAGSTVTGATLTLTFDNWSSGFTVRGYYVQNPWHVSSSLGWLNRDPGIPWAAPGARGSGTDVLASPTFSVGDFAATGVEVKTIALDPAIVQGWIANPATNQGVLLVNEANDAVTRIYSSEDPNPARRPTLTVNTSASVPSCTTGAVGTWTNTAFSSGGNPFTAAFDATPSAANTDAVVGLSAAPASAFSSLAAIVRFNTTGSIDARNGGAYAATAAVSYAAGVSYHFRLVVDVATHTYSIFVTPNGGAEQAIGQSFAFRTEQAGVVSLGNWATTIDSDGSGTISVCNFAVSSGGGSGGSGAGGSAGGGSGGSGGSGAGGGGSTGAGGAGGAPPPGAHPRIWLDTPTLTGLRSNAQAGAAAWTALRTACNSYSGGTVNPVGGDAYPNLPSLGEGYQGSGYFDPLMNVSLCYQIGVGLTPVDPNAAAWGAKGAAILAAMAQFPTYSRDSGYGIRFFGTGMALGFDFLYPILSPTARAQVVSSLNGWFSYYDASGFGKGHPQGNYFAGYYAAKAYAGLATEGDNANATALWSNFLNKLHRGQPGDLSAPDGLHAGVQWYYSRFMTGGGWPEGWGYGGLAVSNMVLPSLAAKTAKGIDLIRDPAAPYNYPLDSGMHLIQFTWPSRKLMDDRDILHESTNLPNTSFPSAPSPSALTVTAAVLSLWSDPLAARFHTFAREVRNLVGSSSPWQEVLFWNETAAEQPYDTLPMSDFASGLNAVAMRSDWSTSATWGSFRATGYVDYGYAGEEYYDAGGLAIVKGGTPLLANATGALVTSYPGTIGQATYESQVSDDVYGPSTPRKLFNTFANGGGFQTQVLVDGSSPPATRVTRVEDRNGYVQMRGENIQAVYTAPAGLAGWTRDVIYLRPSVFVVYDRTTVANTTGDQHMSWHLFFTPSQVAPPSTGATRYDVTNPTAGFLGAATTVLPAGALTSLVDVFGSHKVYRLEVRPAAQATDLRWLTVFDTSGSSGAVALASALSASANVRGVLLAAAGGNGAVLFGAGAAGPSISGPVTFSEPAVATKVVATDLAPSTNYAVTATVAGGNHNVTIQSGSGFLTSANGTLYVTIAAGGGVTAGN